MIKDKETMREYWKHRSSQQKEFTVGFSGDNKTSHYDRTDRWISQFTPLWDSHFDGKTVLDYGCGVGRFTPHLSSKSFGCDITENLLHIARETNPDTQFIYQEDVSKIPLRDNSVEGLWVCTVLQHIVVPEILDSIVSEFQRILLPQSPIVIYENTAYPGLKNPHIHFRSKEEYAQLFAKNGMHLEFHSSYHEGANEEHSIFVGHKK
jgi:ubiquinone/menaquinone biosynthesis C-methylase UbiE